MSSKTEVSDESKPKPAGQDKADPGKQAQSAAEKTRLEKAIAAAQKVVEYQKSAASLKERAKNAANPKERIRLLKEAYQKEVEAHGQSKLAKRLSSGVWQGGAAGGGIGAGIAMGLGTVTGTLVTGIASIPTVLLGGLVGIGVGAIHGPWFTLPGVEGSEKEKPKTEEEIRAQAMKEAEALDQAVEQSATTVPQPPKLDEDDEGTEQNPEEHPQQRQASTASQSSGRPGSAERRKPRKLQVRSGNEVKPAPERRKPKKLEVRSTAERQENQ